MEKKKILKSLWVVPFLILAYFLFQGPTMLKVIAVLLVIYAIVATVDMYLEKMAVPRSMLEMLIVFMFVIFAWQSNTGWLAALFGVYGIYLIYSFFKNQIKFVDEDS